MRRLAFCQMGQYDASFEAVDLDTRHPIPDPGAFVTTLEVGDRTVAWWGPPPTDALRALASALARRPG